MLYSNRCLRLALLVTCLFFFSSPEEALAQWQFWPVAPNLQSKPDPFSNQRLTADSTVLELPFFEDFSSYLGRPSPALWLPAGGAFVSRGMGVNPPSLHVAVLDALNAEGRPYNDIQTSAEGGGDTLCSRFINLEPHTFEDAIYLSFFWQHGGLGERPDTTDYIELQFKTDKNEWRTQWRQKGGRIGSDFSQVILPAFDKDFTHKYFQFRFVSRGRRSGAFDVWCVDYIYLDINRKPDVDFRLDLACSQMPQFFTKPYSAMPYDHFWSDTLTYKRDSIATTLNNFNEVFNVVSYKCNLLNADSKKLITTVFDSGFIMPGQGIQIYMPSATIAKDLPRNLKKLNLIYRFEVKTGDSRFPIDYQLNDSVSSTTAFDNYYAYDDGQAEFAAGINQKFGKIAYQYVSARPDTLTDIDVSFMRVGEDVSNQNYRIYVWKKLDFAASRSKDSVLHVQNASFQYADSLNSFRRIRLSKTVVVSDTFYIGFQQLYENMLPLGLDRNTDSGDRVFFNVTNSWQKNETIQGSFLMRPVFQKFDPTGFQDLWTDAQESVKLYPNPSAETVFVDSPAERLRIFNPTGHLLWEQKGQQGNRQRVDVSRLTDGLYILEIMHKGRIQTAKFVVG
ncbi:MAG: T9SS C-terminal target domain-containing protein [Cytophagales bacterium]|nr:MAG: T9SS C-terminal target domain-containing protein [Cytophagales bacterium]TAF60248.1 MAG: T9SS C-terminal target domain-containing protein [Cytophagales bacterium]